jgi:hypothetical protein
MNLIDAAHKTVHDYPGGSQSLGPRIDMSPAILRNKVNPNNSTHHLTLAEADEIMSVTGDHRILHALAAEHGYVLQKADSLADGGNVLQTLLLANAAEGDFDRVLQEALADNLITPNELKQINDAAVKQQAATLMLLAKLRAFAQAGRG